MPNAEYHLYLTMNGTEVDITDDVLTMQTVSGRDSASQLTGRASAGTLDVELKNQRGQYSSLNTLSSYYGKLVAGSKIRLTMTYSGTTVTLWAGYLKNVGPKVSISDFPKASLSAIGPMSKLVDLPVAPTASGGNNTGTLIKSVLDSANVSSSDYNIATGKTVTGRWYVTTEDALTAIRQLEDTEIGFFYESRDGKHTFEDRHYRFTQSRCTNVQGTFSDADGYPVSYTDIQQADPIDQVFNSVTVEVQPYTVGVLQVVWTLDGQSIIIPPGGSITIIAQYPSDTANNNAAYISAWSDTVVEDITFSNVASTDLGIVNVKTPTTMEIQITNNHAINECIVTAIQASGIPVSKGTAGIVRYSDSASITAYGKREYPFPANWIDNTSEAEGYARFLCNRYKDLKPYLTLSFLANRNGSQLVQARDRLISDRIHVTAKGATTKLGIDHDFFIESIKHSINSRYEHIVTVELSPAYLETYWILGTSQLGIDTKLGY